MEEMFDTTNVEVGMDEGVMVQGLDDIIEQQLVIPATPNVKLLVKKAELAENKDGTYKYVKITLQLVDGIDEEGKYKNKCVFTNVCYYADPESYTKDFFTTQQHLVSLKYLIKATGLEPMINKQFCAELEGKVIKGNIIASKDNSGTMRNDVKNFKELDMTEVV